MGRKEGDKMARNQYGRELLLRGRVQGEDGGRSRRRDRKKRRRRRSSSSRGSDGLSQLPVAVAAELYKGILDELEKNDYDNFNKRAFLTREQV